MTNSSALEQLVACLIQIIGRSVVPAAQVEERVGRGRKHLSAFNMCDGKHTQKDITRKLRIDQGQLSRTFTRWIQSGIAFRLSDGSEARLLHIYPAQAGNAPKKRLRKRKARRAARR